MKHILLCIFLLGAVLIVTAQKTNTTVEISRFNHSLIKVNDSNTEYSIRTKDQTLNDPQLYYEFSRGKGGEKDTKGIRQRNKKYLISSNKDTLATLLTKEDEIIIEGSTIAQLETEDGWMYLDEQNDTLYTIDLFWNIEKWKYNLEAANTDHICNTLNKIVLLSLVDMAQERSKTDCDDNNFVDLWFLLYVSALID